MSSTPEFEVCSEWVTIAKKLVEIKKDLFQHVDTSRIVCYTMNKEEKSSGARPYEMQVDKLPMKLSNQYDYFIWFKDPDQWYGKTENVKAALVASALLRIDPDNTKILPLDYRDQSMMAMTFGTEWWNNEEIPNLLNTNVVFKDKKDAFDDGEEELVITEDAEE